VDSVNLFDSYKATCLNSPYCVIVCYE